jgi:carbamoyltransferase
MGTDLDMMVAGNCLLQKSDQDPALKRDYQRAFKLD